MTAKQSHLFPEIEKVFKSLKAENNTSQRKAILQPLVDFIQEKVNAKKQIRLHFICTHNSRRSHLSQIWAQTAAAYFNIKNVFCYSGGTETTSLFSMVVKTLKKQGFQITTLFEGTNPVYNIKYAQNEHPIIGFSKTYDDAFNPKSEFAAIMTCNNADEGCPIILGAETRFPIKYDDPKAFDNTPQQEEKYEERSVQIASEMFYIFSQIKQ